MARTFEQKVINTTRSQFIYGKEEDRDVRIKELEDKYPIVRNGNKPMIISVDNFSLYSVEKIKDCSKYFLSHVAKEHFDSCVASEILQRMSNDEELNVTGEEFTDLFTSLESLGMYKDYKISSFDELVKLVKETRDFYKEFHRELVTKDDLSLDIADLKIPVVKLDIVLSNIRATLNNSSYFGIILNKKGEVSVDTARVVNTMMLKRFNGNYSIKVACDKESWPTYVNQDNVGMVKNLDYEAINLDKENFQYTLKSNRR